MAAAMILLGPGLFLFMGLGSMYMVYKTWKEKKLIENTPTSKIRSMAMGFVELQGKTSSAGKTVTAPFSGKKGLYCRWSIEQEKPKDEDGHRHFKILKTGSESVPFYLKDSTGQVLVDPTGAKTYLQTKTRLGSGIGNEPPERIKKFLESQGISWKGWVFNKPLRYSEVILEPNEAIYVMGTADKNSDVAASAKHTELIMIKKGTNEKTFYIGIGDEKAVLKRHGLIVVVGGIISGIFTVMGLWLLLAFSGAFF